MFTNVWNRKGRAVIDICYKQIEPSISAFIYQQNAHYKSINTKHPDFVLNSADISIKVTVLPLSYAVYSSPSEHCECALMQKLSSILIFLI